MRQFLPYTMPEVILIYLGIMGFMSTKFVVYALITRKMCSCGNWNMKEKEKGRENTNKLYVRRCKFIHRVFISPHFILFSFLSLPILFQICIVFQILFSFPHTFTVKPLTVEIRRPPTRMVADRRYEIICESSGSRPNAIITWYKGKRQLRRTKVNYKLNKIIIIINLNLKSFSQLLLLFSDVVLCECEYGWYGDMWKLEMS